MVNWEQSGVIALLLQNWLWFTWDQWLNVPSIGWNSLMIQLTNSKCLMGRVEVRNLTHKLQDVSFQAIAWMGVFMKSKFPHFYLFSAHFGGLTQIQTLFQAFPFRSADIPVYLLYFILFLFSTSQPFFFPVVLFTNRFFFYLFGVLFTRGCWFKWSLYLSTPPQVHVAPYVHHIKH